MTQPEVVTYSQLPDRRVSARNGVEYAYREIGLASDGGVPLVLLQHFRGNLDNWDPALIDALATERRVIAFDNAGVGGSTGTTPDTIAQMARDAVAFLTALDIEQADILGFSIGSFVAQQVALTRPALVRRLVLAAAAPQGAAGMHGGPPMSSGLSAHRNPALVGTSACFSPPRLPASRRPQALQRMQVRTTDRDTATTWDTRQAQYDAVCAWGIPDHSLLQRVSAIEMPVMVANGDSDPMILPHYSYLLAGLIPHAKVKSTRLGSRVLVPAPRRVRRRRLGIPRQLLVGRHYTTRTDPHEACPAVTRPGRCQRQPARRTSSIEWVEDLVLLHEPVQRGAAQLGQCAAGGVPQQARW